MVILDTDIMIDLLRDYPPAINWLRSLSDEIISLPGFVVMELIQGCNSKAEHQIVSTKLEIYKTLWPTHSDCNAAIKTFSQFYLSHHIGIIDSLIAQIAISLNLPLQTFNKTHYDPIPGLTTRQPYVKS